MFENLMASSAVAERPLRSSLLAVASHAALLMIAVLATRAAVVVTPASPQVPRMLPYLGRAAAPRVAAATPRDGAFAAAAMLPRVAGIVPVGLPPIEFNRQDGPSLPARLGMPDHDPFTPRGAPMYLPPGDSVHTQGEVDEPVQWLSGPAPVYPSALRAAGIEGVVQLRMVVDTLGRVESATVQVVHSTHSAFEGAALEAVRSARFSPARVAGAAVRQLVQQSVRFAMQQHK